MKNPFLALAMSTLAACAQSAAPAPSTPPPAQGATESIVLGMGCFWGAEKRMSALAGVINVESGYANGEVEGSYEAVLQQERQRRLRRSTAANHAEVVKVVFDPSKTSLERVLIGFWENHDPTQGDRQGNDVGSNYRSAIYTNSSTQLAVAQQTRERYQAALSAAGRGAITTDVAPLQRYFSAEEYHQDYLVKNPAGYCGLGGTGVRYPEADVARASGDASMSTQGPTNSATNTAYTVLQGSGLNQQRQLVVYEAEDCGYCKKLHADVLSHWQSPVAVVSTFSTQAPTGWTLEKALFATPTTVLFENGKETARYTGYNGNTEAFWKWLGFQLLTPEQQRIAFAKGTEPAFTGSHLDEKRPGVFVDPISGVPLFRANSKFDSGSGWPSFFEPLPGAVTLHTDESHGMRRTEVRSASSGIHLGHVFNDGPPPTGQRFCINGDVLRFVPDAATGGV